MSIKKFKIMLSVFFIISVVKLKSEIKTVLFYSESFDDFNATHRIEFELARLTSNIVRPKYNVSCRQLFEMNSVSKNEINIHLEILFLISLY